MKVYTTSQLLNKVAESPAPAVAPSSIPQAPAQQGNGAWGKLSAALAQAIQAMSEVEQMPNPPMIQMVPLSTWRARLQTIKQVADNPPPDYSKNPKLTHL